MEQETSVLEETLLRRNALLPEIPEDLRRKVLAAAGHAVLTRRRRRQQFVAIAAGLCLVCLSVWKISHTDQRPARSPSPGQIGQNPQPQIRSSEQPATPSIVPTVVPVSHGDSPALPIPPRPSTPGGLFQGPILGMVGGSDPRMIEEQLQNRQRMILRVLKQM